MQKRMFYLILVVIALLPLIILSTQCRANTEDIIDVLEEEAGIDKVLAELMEKDTSGIEDELDEADPEEGIGEEIAEGEEDEIDIESDDTYLEMSAPTVVLEIYEGPVYLADENICYYRIRANSTGTPYPRPVFNRDDSHGAWGFNRVQINLYDPDDTFTLTVTATNSEGSATDSLTLVWGCEIYEPEPDPPEEDERDSVRPSEDVVSIGPDFYLSGIVYESGGFIYSIHTLLGGKVIVGDAETNAQIKAYMSFDISALEGKTVEAAEISIVQTKREASHPESFAKTVDYKAFDYGSSLDDGDFAIGGVLIDRIPVLTTSYTVSSDALISELQAVIDDSGRDFFQIKLGLNAKTNNNGLQDDVVINLRDVTLHVRYSD